MDPRITLFVPPIQYLPPLRSHLKNLVSNCSYCPHILFRKREQSNWMRLENIPPSPPPIRIRWLQFTAESHWQWNGGGISFRVNRSENLLRWERRGTHLKEPTHKAERTVTGGNDEGSQYVRVTKRATRVPTFRYGLCGFPRDKKATFQSWLNAATRWCVARIKGNTDDLLSFITRHKFELLIFAFLRLDTGEKFGFSIVFNLKR